MRTLTLIAIRAVSLWWAKWTVYGVVLITQFSVAITVEIALIFETIMSDLRKRFFFLQFSFFSNCFSFVLPSKFIVNTCGHHLPVIVVVRVFLQINCNWMHIPFVQIPVQNCHGRTNRNANRWEHKRIPAHELDEIVQVIFEELVELHQVQQ